MDHRSETILASGRGAGDPAPVQTEFWGVGAELGGGAGFEVEEGVWVEGVGGGG